MYRKHKANLVENKTISTIGAVCHCASCQVQTRFTQANRQTLMCARCKEKPNNEHTDRTSEVHRNYNPPGGNFLHSSHWGQQHTTSFCVRHSGNTEEPREKQNFIHKLGMKWVESFLATDRPLATGFCNCSFARLPQHCINTDGKSTLK